MTTLTAPDRLEVEKAVKEASNSLTRIESERDLIKEIAGKIKEEFDIKPSEFSKLVKLYHKQSRDEEEAKAQELVELYDQIFAG